MDNFKKLYFHLTSHVCNVLDTDIHTYEISVQVDFLKSHEWNFRLKLLNNFACTSTLDV